MKICSYKMYPVLYRLPLSETQRNILALALTFSRKGLRLSNPDIAEILNRHPGTINNVICYLRDTDLIEIEKPRSKYRAIYPGKGQVFLARLNGQVDEFYLHIFEDLLTHPEARLLAPPEGATKGKKEYKKENSGTIEEKTESGLQETEGCSEEELQRLIAGGFLHG